MAATCLHQIAYSQQLASQEYLQLINPTKCSMSSDCAYYRDNKPVAFAKGFTNFQKQMYPEQYRQFMALCIKEWSRNTYFERRRGTRLLSPTEQAFILNTLKEVGISKEMKFDHYESLINWYD